MTTDIVTRLRGQGRPRAVELPTILHEAADEIERLRQALQDVADPLGRIKRQADANGDRLSDLAYQIANSVGYIQSIARDALSSGKQG